MKPAVIYICLEKCVDMTQLKHPVCSNDGHKPRQRGKRLHHEDAETLRVRLEELGELLDHHSAQLRGSEPTKYCLAKMTGS